MALEEGRVRVRGPDPVDGPRKLLPGRGGSDDHRLGKIAAAGELADFIVGNAVASCEG